jgi:hypothetical protein
VGPSHRARAGKEVGHLRQVLTSLPRADNGRASRTHGERRRGMCTGCSPGCCLRGGSACKSASSAFAPRKTSGWFGRSFGCGDHRVRAACCGDSRGSLGRDVRGMKRGRRSFAPKPPTKGRDVQVLYGSDGTRTRDLRRDRPVRGCRQAATGPHKRLHSQEFLAVTPSRYRMVPWIAQPAFGPRVGHEMLSRQMTNESACCLF